MSAKELKAFIQLVKNDPAIQEKLRVADADPVSIAQESGFSVTDADLKRAHAQRPEALTDEQLERIAGGSPGIVADINSEQRGSCDFFCLVFG